MQVILEVLRSQSDMLCCCAMTADSSHMAVGYSDGSVKLWKLGGTAELVSRH